MHIEDDLIYTTDIYVLEAHRCSKSKAFLAGCVMLGAAIEAELMYLFIDNKSAFNRAQALYCNNGQNNKKLYRKKVTELNLAESINLASVLGWLPKNLDQSYNGNYDELLEEGDIGDYLEYVRIVRNLIHPAKFGSELNMHGKLDEQESHITEGYYEDCFTAFEIAFDLLLKRKMKKNDAG